MAKRAECVRRYEALFGKWPGHDDRQVAEWWFKEVFDVIPDSRLESFWGALIDAHGNSMGGPRLAKASRVAAAYATQRVELTAGAVPDCPACRNTGMITLPAAYSKRLRRYVYDDETDRDVVLSETAFPCRCQRGKALNETLFRGLLPSTRDAAWSAYLDLLESCGYPSNPFAHEIKITRKEYLADPPTSVSYMDLVHKLIKSSIQRAERVKEHGRKSETNTVGHDPNEADREGEAEVRAEDRCGIHTEGNQECGEDHRHGVDRGERECAPEMLPVALDCQGEVYDAEDLEREEEAGF